MSRVQDLYQAIEAEDTTRIGKLVSDRPNIVNSTEETPPPIHWAIYLNKKNAVERLLVHGANTELKDQDRNATPLDYAVVYARKDIIRLLVSHGADLEEGVQVAAKGASGGFEEFDELPTPETYEEIAALLEELRTTR